MNIWSDPTGRPAVHFFKKSRKKVWSGGTGCPAALETIKETTLERADF